MGILKQAVCSGVHKGYGDFEHENLSPRHVNILKGITKRERHKFKKFGFVPRKALKVFWELGYLPGEDKPKKGMIIEELLDFLDAGPYKEEKDAEKGHWFYEAIVKTELMPRPKTNPRHIFVKDGRRKFADYSEIRKEPGTI